MEFRLMTIIAVMSTTRIKPTPTAMISAMPARIYTALTPAIRTVTVMGIMMGLK